MLSLARIVSMILSMELWRISVTWCVCGMNVSLGDTDLFVTETKHTSHRSGGELNSLGEVS